MTKFRGSNSGVGHAWANATHDEVARELLWDAR